MARVGTRVRRLKSDPVFNLSARVEASRKAKEKESSRVYLLMQKKYLGTFATKLPCNCGKAMILDHATDHDPDVRRVGYSQRDFVIGPGRTQEPTEKISNFKVFHSYWCDTCGAVYKASVIEGVRKHVPFERRTSQKKWIRERLSKINAL